MRRRIVVIAVAAAVGTLPSCHLFEEGGPCRSVPEAGVDIVAACQACTSAQATIPCASSKVGDQVCSGIPSPRVGERMELCGHRVGHVCDEPVLTYTWTSSSPEIASVGPSQNVTQQGCISGGSYGDVADTAVLIALRAGTTSVRMTGSRRGVPVWTVDRSVMVRP